MAHFTLIHGAWHGAWCWQRLVPLLERVGHVVEAPDLLGMGDDPTPLSAVTLERWADRVAELVSASEQKTILVGHSRGGIVISEVAERVPDRVELLVYLAAFLLPDGATLADVAGSVEREGQDVAEVGPDMTLSLVPEAVGGFLYNTTPAEWVDVAKARVGREPLGSFSTPVHVTPARFGRVPRAYVECEQDRAVPLSLQRRMQAWLPCDPVVTLETDHSPFFSAPADLARALSGLADRT